MELFGTRVCETPIHPKSLNGPPPRKGKVYPVWLSQQRGVTTRQYVLDLQFVHPACSFFRQNPTLVNPPKTPTNYYAHYSYQNKLLAKGNVRFHAPLTASLKTNQVTPGKPSAFQLPSADPPGTDAPRTTNPYDPHNLARISQKCERGSPNFRALANSGGTVLVLDCVS